MDDVATKTTRAAAARRAKKKPTVPLGRPFELTLDQHRELLRRKKDGDEAQDLAFRFDVKLHTIYDYLKRLLPEDHKRFLERVKAGATDAQLAEEFSLTPKYVDWHKKRPVRTA